jgi:putative membrane protein
MMSILLFMSYLAAAVLLLFAFIQVYVRFTPYNEFALIAQNNMAAAIALGGACLGFSITLAASIYFTQSLLEMAKWAVITTGVQMALFLVMRRSSSKAIEEGKVAPAIFLATLSVALGLLNAMSIST